MAPERNNRAPRLSQLFAAKLASSGLTLAQGNRLRFEAIPAAAVAKLGREFVAAGALKIPYWSLDGKPTKFFRLRYLEALPGWAGLRAKPRRYVQPAGSLAEVYFPPLLDRPWRDIAADPTARILVTEGELKAACACARGLACLGLGGVDMWRSGPRGIELLPGLEQITWEQRPVAIIFDSDATRNPDVVRAQTQLAHALAARGALPYIVAIPPAADGAKVGLDDYLLSHSVDDLLGRVNDAQPWAEAAALWALNAEVVYVRDPGLVLVRETAQRMTPSNFLSHAYAHRSHSEVAANGNARVVPTAKSWIAWPLRATVQRLTYRPGQPQVVGDEWNAWRGWGCEPEPGDVSPWTDLLDFLFDGESRSREYFERWCAYPLQYPGTKMFAAAVVWGVAQGTGKSLAGYTLMDIYGANATEISESHLQGAFTGWAQDRQFVMSDEITGSDKRSDANRLKSFITQETMRVNIKHIPEYTVPDCINYYFTSNEPDAFFLSDSDRRYFVHQVRGRPRPAAFYRRYDTWRRAGGARYLFAHLLALPLGDFDPRGPALMTAAKQAMATDGKSDLGSWVAEVTVDAQVLFAAFGAACASELFTPGQLLEAYRAARDDRRATANGIARELKRFGCLPACEGARVSTPVGQQRLYAVRNVARWASADRAEAAEHWARHFGASARTEKF